MKQEYLEGYVYFVHSSVLKKVYVGESENLERINIYKSIIEEQDNYNRIRLYNYYTKHRLINIDLAEDLVNRNNNFEVFYVKTPHYKYLEKAYINFFNTGGTQLYNKKKYKNHKYDLEDIDLRVVLTITEDLY